MTTGDTIPVKVLLNTTSGFMPYGHHVKPDILCQALSFDSPPPACGSMKRLLDIIYAQLNMDEPQAEWAIEYRRRRNRSLSVGDVVVLGEQAWAVDNTGFTPVAVEASQIWLYLGVAGDGGPVYAQPREEA
jgi:hypothetical protein